MLLLYLLRLLFDQSNVLIHTQGRPTAVDFVTSSRSTNGSDERQQMGKEEAVAATVATADIEGGEDMAGDEDKPDL